MGQINLKWAAIVVASIVFFIIGFLWYSPPFFGEQWAKELGIMLPKSGPPIGAILGNFITIVLSMFGIALALRKLKLTGAINGLKISLFITIVFLLPILIGPWLFAGKLQLFLINTGYYVVGFSIAGIIIGAWQK